MKNRNIMWNMLNWHSVTGLINPGFQDIREQRATKKPMNIPYADETMNLGKL